MTTLTVLNPVAEPLESRFERAARPASLEGKRVGLYWNMKSGGDKALDRIEELLRARYARLSFTREHGSVGFLMRHATAADVERVAAGCDVVVGTTAD
jgi:hypothetical protein